MYNKKRHFLKIFIKYLIISLILLCVVFGINYIVKNYDKYDELRLNYLFGNNLNVVETICNDYSDNLLSKIEYCNKLKERIEKNNNGIEDFIIYDDLSEHYIVNSGNTSIKDRMDIEFPAINSFIEEYEKVNYNEWLLQIEIEINKQINNYITEHEKYDSSNKRIWNSRTFTWEYQTETHARAFEERNDNRTVLQRRNRNLFNSLNSDKKEFGSIEKESLKEDEWLAVKQEYLYQLKEYILRINNQINKFSDYKNIYLQYMNENKMDKKVLKNIMKRGVSDT